MKTRPRMLAAEPFGPLGHALAQGLAVPEKVDGGIVRRLLHRLAATGRTRAWPRSGSRAALGVPITDEGIFEAQRALAGEEGIYAEPSAIVGLTAVMQLARQKAVIDPTRSIVVVLTSGGLKDYGASRAWLPAVPSAGPDLRRHAPHPRRTAMGWGSGPSLGVALLGEDAARAASSSAPAPPRRAGFGSLWFIEDYFQTGAFALAGAAAAVTARIAHRHGRGQSVHAPPRADRDGDGDARGHRARTRRARARHGRPAVDRRPDGDPRAAPRSPPSSSASTSSAASGPASA